MKVWDLHEGLTVEQEAWDRHHAPADRGERQQPQPESASNSHAYGSNVLRQESTFLPSRD